MQALGGEGGVIGASISLSGWGEFGSLSSCGEGVIRRWNDIPPSLVLRDEVELNRTRRQSGEIGDENSEGS